MKKIGISTDCMCDLPAEYLAEHEIEVMQFHIHTATGRFWNEREITADNVLSYLEAGNVYLRSNAPEPEECRAYFARLLTRYDKVIHITTSDKIGMSHPNAKAALELMEQDADRVSLVNSGSVSTGLGHMVRQAVTLREAGRSADEIIAACDAVRDKISGSFIVPNADYLYRMGYTNQLARSLCGLFAIHPVLHTKNGKLSIKMLRVGRYENAVMRYVRGELRHSEKIDKKQLFITHSGCPAKLLTQIGTKARERYRFDEVTVTKASVVLSSWCGPRSVGIQFVRQ